ncbi:allantoate amidohydrolase [Oxalobacteraceae bacterium]|nr:allantoate amidohydrolase [Oxalobacteraceae bacterium]
MTITLEHLNRIDAEEFTALLHGLYEHSPWIPQRAAAQRPFATVAALKIALQTVVRNATTDEQLGLVRAHPELAGKAALAGELTAESTGEQAQAGLTQCTAEELATLHRLNDEYNTKFGFPFILAVKGPTGKGLTRHEITAAFTRRSRSQRDDELAECLRQIGRIAEMRLNVLLGTKLLFGDTVMQWSETIGAWSDDETNLTCAFMTDAHKKTANQLASWMKEAGMEVHIDAVGNVVGRYLSDKPNAKTLLTGSHYDTVRNGGKYDGREGILLPIAIVAHLNEKKERLPFHFEIIGFSEEEGVRYQSTFLGSNAIIGQFDYSLLDKKDAAGIAMRDALAEAGHDVSTIPAIARNPADLLGFFEVHIEQGPVLLNRDLPSGVVSSIAGSCRYQVELTGLASHAGTTPMNMRKDAAAAAAELVLFVEHRASLAPSLVGTVGQLQVPDGSVNVIPGACKLSLDIRAADDATRDSAVTDILNEAEAICARRQIQLKVTKIMQAPAAPCAPWLVSQLAASTQRAGVEVFELPSGAGHDAMALARITDVAMLFTRCGNGGISHNPLETMTADDAETSGVILLDFLRNFKAKA